MRQYLHSSQNRSLRYLSPESANTVTITAPCFFLSNSAAICRQPTIAAPDEMPTNKPSSRATRRTMAYAASGLPPDFLGSAFIMRPPVSGVGILVHVNVFIRLRFGQSLRAANSAVGPFGGVSPDDVCAVSPQNPLALFRDVGGHA